MIRYYLQRGSDSRQRRDLSPYRQIAAQSRARQSRQDGGEGGRRIRRLRHADRPAQHRRAARRISAAHRGRAAQLHRPADAGAFARAVFLSMARSRARHIDLRPYILCGEKVTLVPGGLDARRSAQRVAGGELVARRRQQGHLGVAGVRNQESDHAFASRRQSLLDEPLSGAGRAHRAPASTLSCNYASSTHPEPRPGRWLRLLEALQVSGSCGREDRSVSLRLCAYA